MKKSKHVRERLAAAEHEKWSEWVTNMISVLDPNENGELAEYYPDLKETVRLSEMSYAELTEGEKADSRACADKVMEVIYGGAK